MGKYIEIFKTVQEAVYSKDFSSAKKKLESAAAKVKQAIDHLVSKGKSAVGTVKDTAGKAVDAVKNKFN